MDLLQEKITILVCTCDSYEDLWLPFFKLLDTYWEDCNLKIILNTETKSYSYNNLDIKSFPASKDEIYGERILRNLQEVKTEYTLLLLDDFFLRRKVDENKLSKFLEIMDNDKSIPVIYFTKQILNQSEQCKYKGLEKLKNHAMYRLNMQAGLWRTDALKNYWNPIDNPWLWEIFANYTTFDTDVDFLQIANDEDSPFYYGYNPDGMGVFRGKWVYEDVKPLFDKHDINIDYSIRGTYKKETEKNYYSDKKALLKYMIKRMPFKYVISFIVFYTRKNIRKIIRLPMKYNTHCDYLIAKEGKESGKE